MRRTDLKSFHFHFAKEMRSRYRFSSKLEQIKAMKKLKGDRFYSTSEGTSLLAYLIWVHLAGTFINFDSILVFHLEPSKKGLLGLRSLDPGKVERGK